MVIASDERRTVRWNTAPSFSEVCFW